MKPKFITFTGFDDRTNVQDMKDISNNFPVEWGVLISPTNRDSRFPSKQAIGSLFGTGFNLSLHCCGGFSKSVQLKRNFDQLPIEYPAIFKRVQLNGKINIMKHHIIELNEELYTDFIIQKKDFSNDGISQLFDPSGGRGITPNKFPEHPGYMVGYAGGINPYNVLDVIEDINAPEGAEYWIDMESGVRSNGYFDLKSVYAVCMRVYG